MLETVENLDPGTLLAFNGGGSELLGWREV